VFYLACVIGVKDGVRNPLILSIGSR